MTLYRCSPLDAWISAATCDRLHDRAERQARLESAASKGVPSWRRDGAGTLPCHGCPGVLKLARRKATPKPVKLRRRDVARVRSPVPLGPTSPPTP